MMDTKARGWKLRPDIMSNQGLNSQLNASAGMSVYIFIHCQNDKPLSDVHTHTH